MVKILVVGQTPPPYGGQAIMIEKIVSHNFDSSQIYNVPMHFSDDFDEVGKFKLKKVIHLFVLIAKIIYKRFTTGATILYYPPAGPDIIPVIRDLILLIVVRPFFKKVIFHFHAGGISQIYEKSKMPLKKIFERAYFFSDLSLYLSDRNPDDADILRTKRKVLLPYGVKDVFDLSNKQNSRKHINLLYVGVIRHSKGVDDLINACSILQKKGKNFNTTLVGKFVSTSYEKELKNKIESYNLQSRIAFAGVASDNAKYNYYYNADIFCYPTFFESETFGLVLLEAMMFELPIVATKWRGVPDLVEDGINGFLVETNDVKTLAEKIEHLIDDPHLSKKFGRAGREIFLAKYTDKIFYENFEKAVNQIAL